MLIFQSTCPARGTTCSESFKGDDVEYFNPRAPRGARLKNRYCIRSGGEFQSTCPARGTTQCQQYEGKERRIFQSTCPARGTTEGQAVKDECRHISIHVPREGHDHPLTRVVYPVDAFQSTCPARGTTPNTVRIRHVAGNFNPRAPRGARRGKTRRTSTGTNFNPRAPRGARLRE